MEHFNIQQVSSHIIGRVETFFCHLFIIVVNFACYWFHEYFLSPIIIMFHDSTKLIFGNMSGLYICYIISIYMSVCRLKICEWVLITLRASPQERTYAAILSGRTGHMGNSGRSTFVRQEATIFRS